MKNFKRLTAAFVVAFILMSVCAFATTTNETEPRVTYTANGLTTNFPITFDYVSEDGIYVYFVPDDESGTITWVQDGAGATGYTISSDTVVANTAPDDGTLILYGDTPVAQATDLASNRRIPAEVYEDALDKLTIMQREQAETLSRAVKQSVDYLGAPLDTTEYLAACQSAEAGAEAAEAGAVAAKEAAEAFAGVAVDSISDLRGITFVPTDGQIVNVLGYYTHGDDGGQPLYWDSASTATDNGFTIFKVTAITTGRFKSVDKSILNIKHAGAKIDGVTDDTQAFTNAVSVFPSTMIEVEPGTAVISSGTFTSNLFYSHGAFTSNNATVSVIDTTIDNTKRINYFTSNVTVTVGSGGDYATINEAIAYLSTMRPQYDSANIKAEISLLTGFVMEEQVLTWGLDLSWITITGVDAETTIDGIYLTESPSTGLSAYNSTNRPAFGAYAGGKGPRVGQMFDMNGTATDTTQQRCGVVAYGAGSSIDVLPNCGVRRAGWYGILASHNADVTAPESDFSGCLGRGIFANEGGRIEANQIDVSGAVSTGAHSSDAGTITCEGADVSGSLIGISTNNGGRINGVSVNANNCSDTGIRSTNGGFIHAQNATATGCDIGARALSGAEINLDGADCSGATSVGVSAEQGSRINADNVNAQIGGATSTSDLRILTGSIVNFSNGTGGVSETVNTVTANGIIFQ